MSMSIPAFCSSSLEVAMEVGLSMLTTTSSSSCSKAATADSGVGVGVLGLVRTGLLDVDGVGDCRGEAGGGGTDIS